MSYPQVGEKKLCACNNFNFRFNFSLHNTITVLGYFVDRIYPIELEIKDTTDTDRFASCLGLHLEVDSEEWLRTKQMVSIFPL